ncbi:MAG: BadF/BadG/BcrA/BcrD ATPase family protein [Abditibacteriaceae bacterium]
MQLRLGIDGGGTTTRAVIIDENMRDLGRGEAGSSNHYSVGVERTAQNIQLAVAAALQAASVRETEIASWGLGLAGACTAVEQDLLHKAIAPICTAQKLVIDEDVAAAQAGAFGGGTGAVCIAGTGANCFGINSAGQRARADGLGPLLGDRGSGYWIGELTLRIVCKMHDGLVLKSPLLEKVLRQLEVADVDGLVQIVYQPDFERDRIAGLAPIVMQLSRDGDAASTDILQSAGRELAATTIAVLQPLNLQTVAPVGGILSQQTALRETYEAELKNAVVGAQVVEAKYDAVIGAALLAK